MKNNLFLITLLFSFITSISFAQDETKYKTAFDNIEQNCDSLRKIELCYLIRFEEIIERKFNDEIAKNSKLEKYINDNIYIETEISPTGKFIINKIKTRSSEIENSLKELMEVLPNIKSLEGFETSNMKKFEAILEFKLKKRKFDNSDEKEGKEDLSSVETPRFYNCKSVIDEETNKECFTSQMNNHIKDNFNYPLKARNKNIQGRTYGNIVINNEGNVENYIIYGADILLQKETLRILKLLPKFIPGKLNGKNVGVSYAQPLVYKLI